MPATPRVGLLARRALGVTVIAALLAPVVPAAPAYAGGLSVVSTNGQAGANASSNTRSATVVLQTSSAFTAANPPVIPAPTVTFTRNGSTSDQPVTSSVTVNSANSVTFSVALTSANPGPYDITVSQIVANTTTSDSCQACFTVEADRPTVTSTNPSTVAQSGSSTLTVTGTNFAKGNYANVSNYNCSTCPNSPTVAFQRGGTAVPGITFTDSAIPVATTSTTITKVIAVAETVATGPVDVVVTNTNGTSGVCTACFTVVLPMSSTSVSPSRLGQGTSGGTITITGAEFPADVTGSITDPANTGSTTRDPAMTWSFVRDSSTQVRFTNVNVTATSPVRSRDLNLSSVSLRDSLTLPFSIGAAPTATAATLLDGNTFEYGQGALGVSVRVTGTNFISGQGIQGTQLRFTPSTGLTITSSQADSGTSATAVLNIAADAPLTERSIAVVNPDGGTADCSTPPSGQLPGGSSTPCVLKISPAPVISSITPAQSSRGSTRSYTFNGSNLSDADGGDNSPPTITMGGVTGGTPSLDPNNKTTVVNYINGQTSSAVTGPQVVTLVNEDTRGRTVCGTCFTITNLEVTGGSGSGFNTTTETGVTVSGSGFDRNATVELVKTGRGATTVPAIRGTITTAPSTSTPTAADGTSLTADFPLTGADPGTYIFRVTNPPSSTFAGVGQGGLFTVVANAPSLSAVAPSTRGVGAIGETITLTGANFSKQAEVTFSNPGVIVDSLTRTGSTQIAVVIRIASSATASAGTVRVTNTDNEFAESPFTVVAGPRFSTTTPGITPSTRDAGSSTFNATVKGEPTTLPATGSAALLFSGSHITASNVVVTRGSAPLVAGASSTDDNLTATVTVASGPAGRYDVTIKDTSTGGRATCVQCFTVTAAVPSAPTNVVATPGNGSATVTWTDALDNGSPITSYTVTASPDGASTVVAGNPASSPATVTGLTNGVAYQFTVVARNSIGAGPASASSDPVTPRTVPGTPAAVTATPGNGTVSVTWTAPSNGGANITGYVVTLNPGAISQTVTGTSADFSGLTNGTDYAVTVLARNAAGDGAASPAVFATPRTTPSVPTGVSAVGGNRSATVSWTAPDNGGATVTSYVVSVAPGGRTQTVSGNPAGTATVVTGLANATEYTFTVVANNVAGSSAASSPISATTLTVTPTAPTGVTAVAGNGSANVSWTAPTDDGGAPITSYRVNASPGDAFADVTGTSGTVTGLTNGTAYTFTVIANNSQGASPSSAPSTAVTPAAVAPGAPTGVSAVGGNRSATVSWTAPDNGGATITSYVVTANPGGRTETVTGNPAATSATVTGLASATPYTFTVVANNTAGSSAASTPTSATTLVATSTAPTSVRATAGSGNATVTWTAPADNGGAPITSYRVNASPGTASADVTGTSATLTGLTNGTAYTFTVIANNSQGASPASAPSAAVTPKYATTLRQTASASRIRYGGVLTLSGVLSTVANASEAAKPIASAPIRVTVTYDNRTSSIVRLATNAAGQWKWSYRPSKNATYTARYAGSAAAKAATSVSRRALVAPAISITSPANNSTSSARREFSVRGSVSPSKANHIVSLYRLNANGSRTLLKQFRLNSKSAYRLTLASTPRGTFRYQVGIAATPHNTSSLSGVLTARRV